MSFILKQDPDVSEYEKNFGKMKAVDAGELKGDYMSAGCVSRRGFCFILLDISKSNINVLTSI